jgi:hypothetical protein
VITSYRCGRSGEIQLGIGCKGQREGKKASGLDGFYISYLELYIVISPEKQGHGVTTDAAAVHSSMHRSLEDVVFVWDI